MRESFAIYDHRMEPVPLPKGVPETLKEALALGSARSRYRESFSGAITHFAIVQQEAVKLAHRKVQVAPARLSTDLTTILQAAFEGRVGWFYFDNSAKTVNGFQPQGYQPCGKEDLQHLAAVQAILHGGQAFALPTMPDGASAAAIFRF